MTYEASAPFYIVRSQEREGPIHYEEMQRLYSARELQPEHLCWTEGMSDWVPVADVLTGDAKKASMLTLRPVTEIEQETNPYAPPLSDLGRESHVMREYSYGGVTRLPYFLITMGLGIMQGVATEQGSPSVMLGVVAVYLVGSIYITLLRIQNLGISRWWLLWSAVPGLNIVAGYRLMFCQEGWGDSRTLDKVGKISLITFLVIMALAVASVLLLPEVE